MSISSRMSEISSQISEAQALFISDRLSYASGQTLLSRSEFSNRFTSIQMWFLRCSWLTRVKFLRELLQATTGRSTISSVMHTLKAAAYKDSIYLAAQEYTENIFDRLIQDDNRALELSTLSEVINKELDWFELLPMDKQLEVIIGLLRMGGGALCRVIYFFGLQLYQTRVPKEASLPSPPVELRTEQSRTRYGQRPSLLSQLENEMKLEDDDVPPGPALSIVPAEHPTIDDTHPATITLKAIRSKWNNSVKGFKSYAGIVEPDPNKLNKGTKEDSSKTTATMKSRTNVRSKKSNDMDWLQLLPMWIGKGILSYLNEKNLRSVRDVNKFWAQLVDEVLTEMATRNKMKRSCRKFKKGKVKREQIKHDIIYEIPGSESIERAFFSHSIPKPAQSPEQRLAFLEKIETNRRVFSFGRHVISKIVSIYDSYRICAIDGTFNLLAVSSLPNYISMYSLISGAPSAKKFATHTAVTSMVILGSYHQIVSGSSNGMTSCWDLGTNTLVRHYPGHVSAVTCLLLSNEYLISASVEQILVFHANSGLTVSRIKTSVPTYSLCGAANESTSKTLAEQDAEAAAAFYAGFQSGEVIKYGTLTGAFIKHMQAHAGCVTSIVAGDGFFVSGGLDTYLRIWTDETMEEGCMIELFHDAPVTRAAVVGNLLLAASTQGSITIWNITEASTRRVLQVNAEMRPIRDFFCHIETSGYKMIVSMDCDLRILEFYQRNQKTPKHNLPRLHSLYRGSTSKGSNIYNLPEPAGGMAGLHLMRKTRREQRMELLEWRGCADSALRGRCGPPNSTKCIITTVVQEYSQCYHPSKKNYEIFPRFVPPMPENAKEPVGVDANNVRRESKLATIPSGDLRKTFGNKTMLQIFNPHRISL